MGEQEAPGEAEEAKTATGAVDSPWPGRRSIGPPHLHLRRHHGWDIEQCLQRAKGEAGLADYEVRTWRGWYHHQALALVATWFLAGEARRGKKMDAGVDGSAVAEADRWGVGEAVEDGTFGVLESHREPALTPG